MAVFGRSGKGTVDETQRRAAEELLHALEPVEALEVDAVPSDLVPVVAAAEQGEVAPVAQFLAGTRERRDWDTRSLVLALIGERAVDSPLWVRRWAQAEPENPDAQLLLAMLLIDLAWAARTNASAGNVESWRFEEFRRQLEGATDQLELAVGLNPGDPEPWVLAMAQSRGLGEPEETTRDFLRRALDADQWHWAAHVSAVQRFSHKWGGSHAAAVDFAQSAATKAPPDHRLQTLPLVAVLEVWSADKDARAAFYPHLVWAMERGKMFADRRPPDDSKAALTRNLLAYFTADIGMWQASFDQFRATGRQVSLEPWRYAVVPGDSVLGSFVWLREYVVDQLAATSPRRT